MNNRTPLSQATILTIVGLLVAAAGISTLFLTNSVKVPPVPFGPILLVLISGLIFFGRWRWTPVVGVLMSVFLLVGAIMAGGLLDHLTNLSQTWAFTGTWIEMLGVFTAMIAGALATVKNYRTPHLTTNSKPGI
ncbi:MAG TPA: hypothetical protein VLQ48_11495 [Chloroflexia bacterium]|nr:hypothetical protein [Chloroflexia bacterium]